MTKARTPWSRADLGHVVFCLPFAVILMFANIVELTEKTVLSL